MGSGLLIVETSARIGPLTCFRGVGEVRLGEAAEIGQLNWISAAPFLVENSNSETAGTLVLEAHSSLTNRHYLDVSGGIKISQFATVAGVRSVFMTHGISTTDNYLDTAPIVIGEYAMVGGSCNFVMGSCVPARSVVALGSTVIPGLVEEMSLYAGTPAREKKHLNSGAYFVRQSGKVEPRPRFADSQTHIGDV